MQKVFGERGDLAKLTKFRLSIFSVATSACGFLLGAKLYHSKFLAENDIGIFQTLTQHFWLFLHTAIGTTLAALGSAVYNQLLEVESDKKMLRTAERPLPKNRIGKTTAFVLGWLLCAFGVVHLMARVNVISGIIVALTLTFYIFVYTPMKRLSSWNTLVGAVVGALPPLAGWSASWAIDYKVLRLVSDDKNSVGGVDVNGIPQLLESLNWLCEPVAVFLFLFLFFWQIPHFFSLAWMYREQYRQSDYVMLTDSDGDGRKTALAIVFGCVGLFLSQIFLTEAFSQKLNAVAFFTFYNLATLASLILAIVFFKNSSKAYAKKNFFAGLLYLPAVLICLIFLY